MRSSSILFPSDCGFAIDYQFTQLSTINTFIISLGSNLCSAEAESRLAKAEIFLSGLFGPQAVCFSEHYSTPGVGSGVGKTYVNAVATGQTSLTADEIRASLKTFELSEGRTPELRAQGIVPIDLDLLSLGDTVFKPKDLTQNYVTRGLESLQGR